MRKFNQVNSIVIPLDRSNVDTDAIIPKQFLKSVKRSGFGPNLFDDWRYLDAGDPGIDNASRRLNPDFIINQSRYSDARVLLARDNFGCGSSREHAVWALDDFGIRVVIATSFADIFYNNCFKNGILPLVLRAEEIDTMFSDSTGEKPLEVMVDLQKQSVVTSMPTLQQGREYHFEIDDFRKHCLLEGLDDIELTLQHVADIKAYENSRREITPWMFPA